MYLNTVFKYKVFKYCPSLAATRSMTELSYLAAKLFTQSIRLSMVSSGCSWYTCCCTTPQKWKSNGIRGVSWPYDGRVSTDHSVLELLNKPFFWGCSGFRISVNHLKNPLIMNKMAYHKYNFSRWFGNMSHFKRTI